MEHLIELLNEYETPQSGVVFKSYDNYDGTFYGVDCDGETKIAWSDSLITSKKNGFIQRLVENDKIDIDKCDVIHDIYNEELPKKYTRYDAVLMGLAIQDNPIEFLCSILK